MIHYHGTPLSPRTTLLRLSGRHFCVSFAEPRDANVCTQIGQSVMWDNGAFSMKTRGIKVDWNSYYGWLERRLAPPHWAVIPDVIDGSEDDQRVLLKQWPYGKNLGAPVWHMGLSISYLLELADSWPRVCFGSSGAIWDMNTPAWERRCDESFNAMNKRGLLPWVHMLRGLSKSGRRWPFASADSCNVARNFKSSSRDVVAMVSGIDSVQCPIFWSSVPEQENLSFDTTAKRHKHDGRSIAEVVAEQKLLAGPE